MLVARCHIVLAIDLVQTFNFIHKPILIFFKIELQIINILKSFYTMSETKKIINQFISIDTTHIVYGYLSPNKKRKWNSDESIYYLSCCYVGLVEEFQRLRHMFPNKDEDALCQASAGGNFELVKYMISLGIYDKKSKALDSAVLNNYHDIVKFLAINTQQWFLDLHLNTALKREHSIFLNNILYMGACHDNEFLFRFALMRGVDELDEAETIALERNYKVSNIISVHMDEF
jgi:hypothetical protein